MYALKLDFNEVFLINRVIQEKSLYVYNMHNMVVKHFSINTARVRSRSGSLVDYKNYFSLSRDRAPMIGM
jgi:hypothetical protein